ncbi:hypothetical protein BASA81_010787 [Batrachochytrium salamandrivorans]|nr:hypothetical protein BASA81_010787 [Batrachochytrium salamandrivorans]
MKYCSIWASIVFAGLLVALGITFRGHQTPFLWSATRAQYASAPSRVMTLQPTPLVPKRLGLTRLADFGVDFCDNYPPISDDEITLEIRDKLYAGFGMDGLDPNKCSSNNTSRPAVAWNFHEAGLGSNLKQIPNFILLTGLGQEFHLFLLSLTLPHAVAYRYRSFQAWYEQHFVLASIPGTTCHVYEAQCTTGDRCRTNSYWEDGIPRRGRYIIGYAGGFAHNFRTSQPKLYQELAVRLMREVLRMHRSSKVELDKKHKAVLNDMVTSLTSK